MNDSELMERQRIHLAEQERFEVFGETLTRREQFAAMAMQGLVTHCYFDLKQDKCVLSQMQTASIAVNLADALIAKLDKEVVK